MQYQDLQDLTNLKALSLEFPVNYGHLKLGHLKRLQQLSLSTENAECTLLRSGFIRQLIDGLENLKEVYLAGNLLMPSSEQNYELVRRQIQAEVLRSSTSQIERENIRVNINFYDSDSYSDQIPSCSEGH